MFLKYYVQYCEQDNTWIYARVAVRLSNFLFDKTKKVQIKL